MRILTTAVWIAIFMTMSIIFKEFRAAYSTSDALSNNHIPTCSLSLQKIVPMNRTHYNLIYQIVARNATRFNHHKWYVESVEITDLSKKISKNEYKLVKCPYIATKTPLEKSPEDIYHLMCATLSTVIVMVLMCPYGMLLCLEE